MFLELIYANTHRQLVGRVAIMRQKSSDTFSLHPTISLSMRLPTDNTA